MTQPSILVVDDDAHIREVIRYALEKEGWTVYEAENGLEGLNRAGVFHPDVIVLDILMPELNGLEVCRELRKTSLTPILFLSSKDTEVDRILGLELGGDDYVVKPFSPRELTARIHVMLRRRYPPPGNSPREDEASAAILTHHGIALNPATYQASWQGSPVTLTATEFNLLHAFLKGPERVHTRDALHQADVFKDIVTDRTIDSHIRRLRQKFAAMGCLTLIETVHGFGYKLGPCR